RHAAGLGRLVGRSRSPDAWRPRSIGHSHIAAAATTQVITPRRTRLVRVPDLHDFRDALRALTAISDSELGIRQQANPESRMPNPVVVVPTRAAARHAERLVGTAAEFVTRDELYDKLHGRLAHPPRRLTSLEREVIAGRAAREAAADEEL